MSLDVRPDPAVRHDIAVRVRLADPRVPLPRYASPGAAGADIHAWIDGALTIRPGERVLVPTGLYLEIPTGYEAQIRSRSGLAVKNGLFVVNSPGTIDSDYRGELRVVLGNIGSEAVTIQALDRIAQMVVAPVRRAVFEPCGELEGTQRGAGGFGSTGR